MEADREMEALKTREEAATEVRNSSWQLGEEKTRSSKKGQMTKCTGDLIGISHLKSFSVCPFKFYESSMGDRENPRNHSLRPSFLCLSPLHFPNSQSIYRYVKKFFYKNSRVLCIQIVFRPPAIDWFCVREMWHGICYSPHNPFHSFKLDPRYF